MPRFTIFDSRVCRRIPSLTAVSSKINFL